MLCDLIIKSTFIKDYLSYLDQKVGVDPDVVVMAVAVVVALVAEMLILACIFVNNPVQT